MQRTSILIALTAVVFAGSCRWQEAENLVSPAYERALREQREGRVERLTSETGWLTLTGLHWLEPGSNVVGSDPAATVVLPAGKAPARVGTIVVGTEGSRVAFIPEPDSGVTVEGRPVTQPIPLQPDVSGNPTIMKLGSLEWHLIERSGRLGIRARDREHPARQNFPGIDYFPIDQSMRVVARLEAYDPPKQIPIQNIIGTVEPATSPGALVFTIDGREHRLDPILEGDELFVIFADATNGEETYPAGRYLYAEAPKPGGSTILDFNEAYNPPCAFTEYATCPLPPRQNRLPIRIEAGEKAYHLE